MCVAFGDEAEGFGTSGFSGDGFANDDFTHGGEVEGLDGEDRPIERECTKCGKTFNLTIEASTELPPEGKFSICENCLRKLADEGRRLLDGDKPVYD